MPDAINNPYNFGSLEINADGATVHGQWDGTSVSGNTLLGFKDAFAKTQNELNDKAASAMSMVTADPSNLANVAGYTTANAAMMNLFGAQSNAIKSIADKVDQILRNLT
jgi:hypothetical protein